MIIILYKSHTYSQIPLFMDCAAQLTYDDTDKL